MAVTNVNYQTATITTGTADTVVTGEIKTSPENGNQADGVQSTENKSTKQATPGEVEHISEEMNKFMELINSDIRFVLHEKTHRLIVQVVDSKEGKVLKEFPPHELLDTMAKIKEYVGVLLDKKA